MQHLTFTLLTLHHLPVLTIKLSIKKTLISRERDRLWVDMEIKQGETNSELISRIRYEATTCDFSSMNKQ